MDWRRWFQPHILDRGFEYYQNGLVEDYETDHDYIQATVQGSSEYYVHIDILNGEILDMECECPYAEKGSYCKHMAAVLYCMQGDVESDVNRDPEKKQENTVRVNKEDNIHKLVESADEATVKKFLVRILNDDEKLYNRFKTIISNEISPEDIKKYKKQINKLFRKYAESQDFIDYYNANFFVIELKDFLQNDIDSMLDNQHYRAAFDITNYIFVKLGNQDMDDSDGGTTELADMCQDIWQDILDYCEPELKKDMFRWFMEHLDKSVIDYMEEYIEDTLFGNFEEEIFLDEKLKFLDERILDYKAQPNFQTNSYYAGKWVVQYIELLKDKKMSQEIIKEYCKDNIGFSDVRNYYVSECIENKDFEEAIQLLKEGKEKDHSFAGLVADYSFRLKNLYKQIGRMEDYEQELWSLLLKHKAGDMTVYNELKTLYTKDEWVEKRELIFEKLPRYVALDRFYKEEKLFNRLLKIVLESTSLNKLMEYETCLKKIYPEELLNKYEIAVKDMADLKYNRNGYRELVAILKRMLNYPGGKKRVDEIALSWRTIYKRRPAMMDELNKL